MKNLPSPKSDLSLFCCVLVIALAVFWVVCDSAAVYIVCGGLWYFFVP